MTALYSCLLPEEPIPETVIERLPDWRRERTERMKHPGAKKESLCAGLLFARVMALHGVEPNSRVELLPAGKPVFAGNGGVYFSLSHSGEYVLMAISDRPVGTDVQRCRKVSLSIARRFHPSEQAWLNELPESERQAGLFRMWVRKEAWVKAVSGERVLTLEEADVLHGLPGLYFCDYTLPEAHFAALCGEDEGLPQTVIAVDFGELLREV